ncbi:DUF1697 domain-containing protein [Gorillibacterium sp. sgz5001074]|uniref:DUF1697 domain-containing protein n=1 Tax=Gorillibacterium sp. sgz5001074 TaxID=3446695 RepID=UPI003F66C633
MAVYIALLRGINVGGKNKIPMAELKSRLEGMGLERVQTYIASGNVLFETGETEELELRRRLEAEILAGFGISLTVVLRTSEEWERIVRTCPYREEDLPEGGSIQLSLMIEPPTDKQIERLLEGKSELDQLHVQGREIYFRLGQSMLDSKLMDNLAKLKDVVTTRNWNTIKKLAGLAVARK